MTMMKKTYVSPLTSIVVMEGQTLMAGSQPGPDPGGFPSVGGNEEQPTNPSRRHTVWDDEEEEEEERF